MAIAAFIAVMAITEKAKAGILGGDPGPQTLCNGQSASIKFEGILSNYTWTNSNISIA